MRGVGDLAGRKVAVVNRNVATHLDLLKALSRFRVGERVSVSVLREGRLLSVQVTLGELQALQAR